MRTNICFTRTKVLSTLVIILLLPLTGFSQKNIAVSEKPGSMSMGTRNGFQVELMGQSKKDVEDALEDLLREYDRKAKLEKTSKNEFKADDVLISSISDQPIDLYFLFDEKKEACLVTGFFDLGTSFLSSQVYPDRYRTGELFMQKLGLKAEKMRLAELVGMALEEMEGLERDKDGLVKDKLKLDRTIADCEATISKAKEDLNANASAAKKNTEEISKQKEKLDALQKELDRYKNH